SSSVVVFDLGFEGIGGPASDIEAIWKAVPGAIPLNQGQGKYQFPCKTNVTISVSFGGKVWPIDPIDINLGPVENGSSQCIGAMEVWSPYTAPGPNWNFGRAFLKNVYSVFRQDPPSMGFARLA
ncbi:aspartic peptidase domain-containing protein, partial [Mycena capillaripes]